MAMKMDQVGAWVVAILLGSVLFIGLTWSLTSTKSPIEKIVEQEKNIPTPTWEEVLTDLGDTVTH